MLPSFFGTFRELCAMPCALSKDFPCAEQSRAIGNMGGKKENVTKFPPVQKSTLGRLIHRHHQCEGGAKKHSHIHLTNFLCLHTQHILLWGHVSFLIKSIIINNPRRGFMPDMKNIWTYSINKKAWHSCIWYCVLAEDIFWGPFWCICSIFKVDWAFFYKLSHLDFPWNKTFQLIF